jgi:VanZ family protein
MPKIGASGVDKVIHFGMFFVWALAWLAALGEGYWRLSSVFVGGLILASATELAQGVLPWKRSPDFFDWGFDMAGVVLACAGWWVLGRLQIRKRRANSSADA